METIGREVDGPIEQAREMRRRAAFARTEAVRIRHRSAELIERAEAARHRWTELYERTLKLCPGHVPLHSVRRYIVLVRAMQTGGQVLRRGDVVTDELIQLDFRALVEQRILDPWDYNLPELKPPSDPSSDGNYSG